MKRTRPTFNRLKTAPFVLALTVALLIPSVLRAEIRFFPPFSDSMVVQRDRPVRMMGEASPNEKLTVTLGGSSAETVTGRNGVWSVTLDPLPAGGPFELVVSGRKDQAKLTDVMVGDVWLCVGSDLMSRTPDENFSLPTGANDLNGLRLLKVEATCAEKPKTMFHGEWQLASADTIGAFSAVAFVFGRELNRRLGVPIGIVAASSGHSTAEAWTSPVDFDKTPLLEPLVEPARNENKPNEQRSGALWNGTLAPLTALTIRGAVFDPGTMNAGRAYQFRTLIETLIHQWRAAWGEGDFPFYYVNLEAFPTERDGRTQSAAAELREALCRAESLRRVRGIVTADLGRPSSTEKIGERLAALAVWDEYKAEDIGTGPTLREMKIEKDRAVLFFDFLGGGLATSDGGQATGFFLAGTDGEFFPADAAMESNRVTVTSKFVPTPAAVRYNWADGNVGNLQNIDGFPAPPFRTDHGPGVTEYGR